MSDPVKPVGLVRKDTISSAWLAIAMRPPALTRLEPQSVSGDPRPGAEAVVADPLWMIGRQWQLGELLGEDVGTPVSVLVERRALPVTAWAPLGGEQPAWRPWLKRRITPVGCRLAEASSRKVMKRAVTAASSGAMVSSARPAAGAVAAFMAQMIAPLANIPYNWRSGRG